MIFLVLAAGFVIKGPAEPICINITAEVAEVDDRGNVLSGVIVPGDIITGTYIYESTTVDSHPLETVGDYRHTTSPFGITLNANGYLFRTDPNNVDFLIEIVNGHGYYGDGSKTDNYLLISYNNIFDTGSRRFLSL